MRSAWVLATVLAACALFGVLVVGCLGKPKFECAGTGDCEQNGMQGMCQPDNFCSFPDSSCPITGQRYGDLSGPMANQCVGAPIDAPIDAYVHDAYVHDARECFGGSGAYSLCFTAMPPMGAVTLAGTLNTDNDVRCMAPPANWMGAGQPDACMILGKSITISTVAVSGAKALILLADTIQINGTLDVASHRGGTTGPAAPFATCPNFSGAGNASAGAGGGAGGSFMRAGGNGGSGDNGAGGGGGIAPPALGTAPTVLRGGCNGQTGGIGQLSPGPSGKGGGTVFLTASKITFGAGGTINASGAGGTAGGDASGGSGGGSGGMIVLHAAETITGSTGAKVMANGGGASSGGGMGQNGASGNDPSAGSPATTVAQGGTGGGGAGGDGYAGSTMAQTGAQGNNNRGGGGGGGGGGYIQSNIAMTNVASSPPVMIVP